jgi:hypothetical protein
MANRVKSVYGTDEIPHLWAHRLPKDRRIRNARGNLYAEGDTLYSYGPHFPIARRVVRNGEVVYLYTTRRYSATTRGHCRLAERAMSGNGRRFDIDPVDGARRSLWEPLAERKGSARPVAEWYQSRIDRCALYAMRPRIRSATRMKHLERAAAILEEWRAIHSAFGLRIGVGAVRAPDSLDEVRAKYATKLDALERTAKEEAEREEAEREEAEREEAERERLALSLIPEWRAGGSPILPGGAGRRTISVRAIRYPLLRIVNGTGGAEVETSWGARVPVDEAHKALRILGRLLERGDSSELVESIGHYRGMRLEGNTVHIGCHPIPLDEVRAFCDAAGWTFPAPATVPA